MIEQLMNQERPYGEPEYSKLTEQTVHLKQALTGQLDQEGIRQLEQLTDFYIRQESAALRDAFSEGFCAALGLILEFYGRTYHDE